MKKKNIQSWNIYTNRLNTSLKNLKNTNPQGNQPLQAQTIIKLSPPGSILTPNPLAPNFTLIQATPAPTKATLFSLRLRNKLLRRQLDDTIKDFLTKNGWQMRTAPSWGSYILYKNNICYSYPKFSITASSGRILHNVVKIHHKNKVDLDDVNKVILINDSVAIKV